MIQDFIGSGKKIANSVRDLKNAVNSQESESRDDRDWFTTYRFDMDSYKHPLYCGYTSGGSSHRFLSSEDAAVLGLPIPLFTRRLCGACVKIEYKDVEMAKNLVKWQLFQIKATETKCLRIN